MSFTVSDEGTSQSSHSPGPVRPEEILLRLGFHPEHTEDGKITAHAISRQDLKNRGFSVNRKHYVSHKTIKDLASQQQNNVPTTRKKTLISSFSCKAVRELIDSDGDRAFVVIDEAESDNPAHASIYSASPRGDGAIKKMKKLLLPLLQDHIDLEAFLQTNPSIS
jgi:hypothetical protein